MLYLCALIYEVQPIIQVGYNPVCSINGGNAENPLGGLTLDQQAIIAANLVDSINNVEYTSNPIVYWIIGNEPNKNPKDCGTAEGPSGGYGYNSDNSSAAFAAGQIAEYIKKFSSKMKAKDASIKIIGPETSYFRQPIMQDLTSPGGISDITGRIGNNPYFYIDVYSFHIYNGFSGSQSRDTVVNVLTAPGKFQDNLTLLKTRLASCNSFHNRSGSTALKMAVDEANVNSQNPANDPVTGVGAGSFLGGQFWAEMMGICMKKGVDFLNFWSVKEGCNPPNGTGNIGYLNGCNGTQKKPAYYHYQLIAKNFSGDYYAKE
ncbi:MAG: hypothetical protein K8R85_08720 [Bacteroidetes bacterium]|nr:hypothetical protein [Bacteroidota bacterium]